MKIQTYSPVARAFHWSSAALMFTVIPIAWYMGTLDRNDPSKSFWMAAHKSIGVTILLLTLFRIAYRTKIKAPELPDTFSSQDKMVSHAAHIFLYFILLAMPISGYLMSILSGHPVNWFGLFEIPAGLSADKPIGDIFHILHKIGQWVVYAVIALHLLAVAKHVKSGNGILERMWPNKPGRSRSTL
jgi:cytochrome b561